MLFQKGYKRFEAPASQPASIRANRTVWRRRLWNGLLVGLSIGPIFGLGNGMIYGTTFGIQDGLTYWLTFLVIGTLLSIIPMGMDKKIHPTEILTWSWRSLRRSLLSSRHRGHTLGVALSLGLIIGLTSGLSTFFGQWLDGHSFSLRVGAMIGFEALPVGGLAYGLTFIIGYWSLLGLFKGLSSEYLPEDRRVKPNEGIRRSFRIGILVGLSSGIVTGLIGVLSTMLYFGLYAGLGQGLSIGPGLGLRAGLSNALHLGLYTGLMVGLQVGVCGALLAGAPSGGLAGFRHCVLRVLLWQSHSIPLSYPRFLDKAAEGGFLLKVGGGYMFIHREFQNYMASLDPAVSEKWCFCGHQDNRLDMRYCPVCGKQRYNEGS